jgi:hypothetical protein
MLAAATLSPAQKVASQGKTIWIGTLWNDTGMSRVKNWNWEEMMKDLWILTSSGCRVRGSQRRIYVCNDPALFLVLWTRENQPYNLDTLVYLSTHGGVCEIYLLYFFEVFVLPFCFAFFLLISRKASPQWYFCVSFLLWVFTEVSNRNVISLEAGLYSSNIRSTSVKDFSLRPLWRNRRNC